MRYTPIALSGQAFNMPAITLGSVFFGTRVSEKESFAIMDAYYEAGGNWLDTARIYCTELVPEAERTPCLLDSEEVIGRWIAARKVRDQVTVVTKGAHWSLQTKEKRVTPDLIRSDMDLSLKKLGLEQVDIYLLHYDDPSVPVEVIMPVMDELIKQGKTRAVGCSNWKIARVREANAFAEANGLTPFSISQVRWSYAVPTEKTPENQIDMEGNPAEYIGYQQAQMPVMAYSSQAKGFFIKAARGGFAKENLGRAAAFLCAENERRAERIVQIAREEHISPSAAAFAYLWTRTMPVTALVGPSSAAQLRESLLNCDYMPSDEAKALFKQL